MILDDGGDATLLVHLGTQAETDPSCISHPTNEEETELFASIKRKLATGSQVLLAPQGRHQGRDRGDDHGGQAPVHDAQGRQARLPRHQRQRLGHQVEVRQSLRLPRVAGRRHQARDRRDDRRQGGGGRRLRRRGQGLRAGAARALRPGVDHRDRSDLRAAGGDGRLSRRDDGLRRRQGGHLRHRHRQHRHHHVRAHEADEEPGDRLQHRPLRQRDRGRGAQGLQVGEHQAAGRPRHLPGRQADHPAGRRAPREPGLRHRPSVVRDELVVRQPGDGADRAVGRSRRPAASSIRSASTCCPSISTRRWRGCSCPSSARCSPTSTTSRRATSACVQEGPYKPDSYRY